MWFFALLFYAFTLSQHVASRSLSSARTDSGLVLPRSPAQPVDPLAPITSQDQGPPRDVHLLIDTKPEASYVTPDGKTVFYTHTSVLFSGTELDAPYKIEFAADTKVLNILEGPFFLRVLVMEYTKDLTTTLSRPLRKAIKLGQVTARNLKLYDPIKVSGVALDAFQKDPLYRDGFNFKDNLNDCNSFAKRLAGDLNLQIPQEANDLIEKGNAFQSRADFPGTKTGGQQMKAVAYVNQDSFGNERIVSVNKNALPCTKLRKRQNACGTWTKDESIPKDTISEAKNEAIGDEKAAKRWPPETFDLDANKLPPADSPTTGKDLVTDLKTSNLMVRAGNALKTFTAVGKEALAGLGVAGTVAGAIFVILDFIKGDWVGAAIGTVGLVAGLAVAFATSGPVGWIIGGIVAALFAILPGLFKNEKPYAKKEDIQGIIQRTMFGDATHTGNEQCQKGTADVPGNPDCQALYGAGTLSAALGLNNFDAIALLIQYNEGYPITIKELASAFGSSDKIATFECHNEPRRGPFGKEQIMTGDDPSLCVKPTYAIDRTKITLPNINLQASAIYDRIIPAANGDCKLVSYPGTSKFPSYGLEISGLPSVMACGVTADTNGDGVWTGLEAGTSTANESTNGQNGAYVAPPPQKDFASLTIEEYPCISAGGDTKRMMCLPPGTYGPLSGDQVAVASKDVDTLTLPKAAGWGVKVHWEYPTDMQSSITAVTNRRRKAKRAVDFATSPASDTSSAQLEILKRDDPPNLSTVDGVIEHEWRTPQAATHDFALDFQAIGGGAQYNGHFTILAPDDGPHPVCCLFSDVNFGGNVFCAGEGGGPVPPAWKDLTKSISCHAGGQAWIYADSYGDAGGAKVDGDVKDLTSIPYGPDKNFGGAVKAWWVSKV